MNEMDIVIARLEEAARTTASSMQEIAAHWDAVHVAHAARQLVRSRRSPCSNRS
jgi:hypothetical protein